jgi:hypothetical protein
VLLIALLTNQLAPVTLVHSRSTYRVQVKPHAARPLEVWQGSHRIAHGLLTRYHPWCLQIADVDGRGAAIAVGVDKPTHNIRFAHRTLFLISFDGHQLKRKWTGSTMGRPLLEFCFAPGVPQRLVTLETCMDDRVALSSYHWSGFGFRKDRERLARSASGLRPAGDHLTLRLNRHQVSLRWSEVLQ